ASNIAPGRFHPSPASHPINSVLFVRAEVKSCPDYPYLPQFLAFSSSAEWLVTISPGKTKIVPVIESTANFLEATFEATLTNYGGLTLPAAFELKKYAMSTDSGQARLRYVIAGRVTEVSPSVELADFLPHLPVVAAI